MHRLFGSATPRSTTPGPSVATSSTMTPAQELADALEMLAKREAHVGRLIDKEIEMARTLAAAPGRTREALECMKRKKLHEKEIERLGVQKLNLMQQESQLQQLKFNNIVVRATERGAVAIEKEVKALNGPEGIERVQDRLEDALANGAEVLEASARPIGDAALLDDSELLEELEQMDLAAQLSEVTVGEASSTTARVKPAPVPRTDPVARAEQEREEERQLAELASMTREAMPMPMPMMAAPMMAACH